SSVTGPASRSFSWTGSTDNVEVAGYEVLRDGALVARLGPLATSTADAGIPAGTHTYTVRAFDNASPRGAGGAPPAPSAAPVGQLWGNRSLPSTLSITQADIVPPTAPTSVTVVTGNGKATPSWSGATDNVGVVSYSLFRNNALIRSFAAPTATFKDSGLV